SGPARTERANSPQRLAFTLQLRACWLNSQQRNAEAQTLVDEALPLVTDGSVASDQLTFQLQMMRAEYRSEELLELAVPALQAAFAAAARHPGELGNYVNEATARLVATLDALDRPKDAIAALERALQIAGLDPGHAQQLRQEQTRTQAERYFRVAILR